ncbi:hypothetical protein [Endozoicomonas euniceicola]|uniref:Uncharacterized protein n=1 Tax=Endozoicomonas euniceicola TaxID=1234143 RepID=A0ABY6GVZ2_9GAMM|nr:hypothetical protein [Endozoicomonas euniceicola]UYM16845.1 hypothetical protein NX720_02655 [Endozoicomonas euniceicola]
MRKYNLLKMLSQFLLVLSFFFFIAKGYGFSATLQIAPWHKPISLLAGVKLKAWLSSENIRDSNKSVSEFIRHYMVTAPNHGATLSQGKETTTSGKKTGQGHFSTEQNKRKNSQPVTNNVDLLNSLTKIGTILKKTPDVMLILVWDIDDTISYRQPNYQAIAAELQLNMQSANSFESWRKNGQLMLILNTARAYDEFDFFNPELYVPQADFIITNGGSRYFINNSIHNGFSLQKSQYTEFFPGVTFPQVPWQVIIQPPCVPISNTASLEIRCPQGIITNQAYNWFFGLLRGFFVFGVWGQHIKEPGQHDLIFAYHKVFNKGAAFARLINIISGQVPDIRKKVKWVATAGDSLMDTSMMNTRMDYPFNAIAPTPQSPGLPVNTTYIGTVLSKGGYLQEKRFKPLFDERTTVHSRVKSIAGIIEGTAELLLRHISGL